MDTTITALKALYAALGGTPADVADITIIPDMINAIATVAATAVAKELPTVAAKDNGKVLKVADGKWAVGTDETTAG